MHSSGRAHSDNNAATRTAFLFFINFARSMSKRRKENKQKKKRNDNVLSASRFFLIVALLFLHMPVRHPLPFPPRSLSLSSCTS